MFSDYQLSDETKSGLKEGNFTEPTPIQQKVLEVALKGEDVIGIAKTGSGKTLAFIIPILESLHENKWSQNDGLGAIVITPTRELAYQIFEVLRIVGQKHSFSAALVIGGKDLALERSRIQKMNIIICTPGRLLQHMDENPLFNCDNLKILIIDEADRILDLGFSKTMDSIVEFLPRDRQCLLFSATLSSSTKELIKLSLKEPRLVEIRDTSAMPEKLRQHYTVINIEQKLSFLWSFIRNHKKSKVLIFIATCKQTRFLHRLLSRMQPGISINALYGSMHQLKRMDVYNKFADVRHCVLLATDVASRGLDFPDVDWVVQLDCPEDINSYIHKAGRTARLDKSGRSLMVLMPNEKDFIIKKLKEKNIPIEELPCRPKHLQPIESKVGAVIAKDVELKEEAKRAFKCYLKCLLNNNFRHLFKIESIDLQAYARSLGLIVTPRVRLLERHGYKLNQQNVQEKDSCKIKPDDMSKSGKKFKAAKQTEDQNDLDPFNLSSDEEILQPTEKQRVIPEITNGIESETQNAIDSVLKNSKSSKPLTKVKLAKKLIKKNIKLSKHIVFDNKNAS